jgi:hypothetical protein
LKSGFDVVKSILLKKKKKPIWSQSEELSLIMLAFDNLRESDLNKVHESDTKLDALFLFLSK